MEPIFGSFSKIPPSHPLASFRVSQCLPELSQRREAGLFFTYTEPPHGTVFKPLAGQRVVSSAQGSAASTPATLEDRSVAWRATPRPGPRRRPCLPARPHRAPHRVGSPAVRWGPSFRKGRRSARHGRSWQCARNVLLPLWCLWSGEVMVVA